MPSAKAQAQCEFAARFDVTRGRILLLGDAGCNAAERIEAARGWPVTRVRDFDETQEQVAKAGTGAALVVTELGPHSIRPMLALARHSAVEAPGLSLGYLAGRDSSQLLESAERTLNPAPDGAECSGPVRLFNMLPSRYPIRAAGLFDARGDGRDARQVIEIFQQDSALDFLVGHSNGCDMGLGGVLLCRRDSVSAAPKDELRVMPCYHGAPCSRHAGKKGTVTSSDLAGARRVIAACCWGAIFGQGPFSPEYSIGESLLFHSGVSTLLTTLRVTGFETPELTLLYHYCAAGVPFGAVASLANRLRLAAGFEAEWICFGDPGDRIAAASETVRTEVVGEAPLSADVHIPSSTANRDICSLLPKERIPREPVALTRASGSVVSGAVSPEGAIFLTTSAGPSQTVHVDIVPRSDLKQSTDIPADLLPGLESLAIYLQGPLRDSYPREIAAAAESYSALRRLLAGWTLGSTPVGSLLRYESIAGELEEVTGVVAELGSRILDLAAAYTLRSGCMQSHLWSWAYDQSDYLPDIGRCLQCGSPVSETEMQRKTGDGERRLGFCDGCGFLYDGYDGMERLLRAPDRATAGTVCELAITCRNPSRFKMPVSALGVFDRYETEGSTLTRREFLLDPGEESSCNLCIEIPADAVRGVNYVGATTIIGTNLGCYQRPIWIT